MLLQSTLTYNIYNYFVGFMLPRPTDRTRGIRIWSTAKRVRIRFSAGGFHHAGKNNTKNHSVDPFRYAIIMIVSCFDTRNRILQRW